MDDTDLGKIATVVNEFGNLKGVVHIYYNGKLTIDYNKIPQTLEPHVLINLLTVKINEYCEEQESLINERHEDDGPDWRERNLKSYIGYLTDMQYKLNELATYQKEQEAIQAAKKE